MGWGGGCGARQRDGWNVGKGEEKREGRGLKGTATATGCRVLPTGGRVPAAHVPRSTAMCVGAAARPGPCRVLGGPCVFFLFVFFFFFFCARARVCVDRPPALFVRRQPFSVFPSPPAGVSRPWLDWLVSSAGASRSPSAAALRLRPCGRRPPPLRPLPADPHPPGRFVGEGGGGWPVEAALLALWMSRPWGPRGSRGGDGGRASRQHCRTIPRVRRAWRMRRGSKNNYKRGTVYERGVLPPRSRWRCCCSSAAS